MTVNFNQILAAVAASSFWRVPRRCRGKCSKLPQFRLTTASTAVALAMCIAGSPAIADSLNQDFEEGIGGWFADNGVWEVGTPAGGPGCHGGTQCAGTVLDGNYPFVSSRLVSAPVELDSVSPGQFLSLRFWHWFSWGSPTGGGPDHGYVEVSTFDQINGWSAWTTISTQYSGSAGVWSETQVDMTPYAGKLVRVGFLHVGNYSFNTGPGWFIDDVDIPGAVCTNSLSLTYSGGALNIEASNGTSVPGTWNLSIAKRNRISRLRSEPIDVTDPPAQTLISIPNFPDVGEVGVLSSINIPGKGIACSAWQTVTTSRSQ